MPETLFVYGTLMTGMASGGLLSAFPHAEATCRGQLYRSLAGAPILVPSPDGRPIRGELITLPDPGPLMVLDLLEGVKSGRSHRRRVPVEQEGRGLEAWAWVLSLQTVELRAYAPLPVQDWRTVAPREPAQ